MPNEMVSAPLLCAETVTKIYAQRRPLRHEEHRVVAVDGANLKLFRGETLGLVGTSGSGKSSLALCMAGLERPTRGTVRFAGDDVFSLHGAGLRRFRQSVQLVLQDSAMALNPRFTALEIVCEPLRICRLGTSDEQRASALELIRQLELPESVAQRHPHELSGGQRQRLAIARALTLKPDVLILDEVLTGLDVPVQIQFLELLRQLSFAYSFATLFISHDLRLMGAITQRLAVMHEGKIVEQGMTRDVFARPQQAHTRALLRALPLRGGAPCVAAGGD